MGKRNVMTFDVSGLDDFLKDVDRASRLNLRKHLQTSGDAVKTVVEEYPAETIANWPSNPTGKWYERGYGPRSRTGWGKRTSEKLGASWGVKTAKRYVDIFTTVTYAKWVQGFRQTRLHKSRDWPGLKKAGEKEIKKLGERIMDHRVQIILGKK